MIWWAVFTPAGEPIARNVIAPDLAAVAAQYEPGVTIIAQAGRVDDASFQTIARVSGALVDDVDRARAWALDRIDRERAAAGDAVLTEGRAVTLAYNRKGDEAADFASLSADEAVALGASATRARFPFLSASAELRGVAVATIAAEVRAGKAASEAAIARVEAKADAAKHAARTATTVAAITAAASIAWED